MVVDCCCKDLICLSVSFLEDSVNFNRIVHRFNIVGPGRGGRGHLSVHVKSALAANRLHGEKHQRLRMQISRRSGFVVDEEGLSEIEDL